MRYKGGERLCASCLEPCRACSRRQSGCLNRLDWRARSRRRQNYGRLLERGQATQVAIGQLEGGGSTTEAHGMLSSLVVRREKERARRREGSRRRMSVQRGWRRRGVGAAVKQSCASTATWGSTCGYLGYGRGARRFYRGSRMLGNCAAHRCNDRSSNSSSSLSKLPFCAFRTNKVLGIESYEPMRYRWSGSAARRQSSSAAHLQRSQGQLGGTSRYLGVPASMEPGQG
ncbi:hypothetical protein ACQKWADRAFT_56532 [Trichoderma austrokoningii]